MIRIPECQKGKQCMNLARSVNPSQFERRAVDEATEEGGVSHKISFGYFRVSNHGPEVNTSCEQSIIRHFVLMCNSTSPFHILL